MIHHETPDIATLLGLALLLASLPARPRPPTSSQLKKGDRIILIGNTLAERMQYFGNFETLLHSRFPDLDLVVHDLGWSADELTLRPRSQDFKDHGHTLEDEKPDVLIAAFGFNESFGGPDGLAKFKKDLDKFIKRDDHHQVQRQGRRRSSCSLSPIAHEDLHNAAHAPTARRTTRTSSSTPTRWPRPPRSTASSSSTCSRPTPGLMRRRRASR